MLTERCGMRKVAIGMPVWNGEKFVSEAIESHFSGKPTAI